MEENANRRDSRFAAATTAAAAVAAALFAAMAAYGLPAGRKGLAAGVGAMAALVGGMALFVFPQIGVHAMALLMPWERYQVIPGLGVTAAKLVGAGLCLVFAVHLVGRSIRGVPRTPFDLPLACFLTCCLLSLVFARDPVFGLAKLASFVSYALIAYAVPAFLTTKRSVARACVLLWASIVAVSAFTLLQVLGIVEGSAYGDQASFVGGELVERSAGTSLNPAVFICFPVFGVGLALGIFQSGMSLRLRAAAAASLPILALAIYWSYTRSALMGLGAMGAAYGFVYARQRLFWIPVFLCAAVAGLLLMPPELMQHFSTGFSGQEVSAGQRVLQYRAAWEILNATYFRGIGFANTDFIMKGYRVDFDLIDKTLHSMPYTFLLETGIQGFVAFLWLVAATLGGFRRQMLRTADANLRGVLAGVSLAFVGYLVHTLFHNVPYLSVNGLIAGIGAAAWNVAIREEAAAAEPPPEAAT